MDKQVILKKLTDHIEEIRSGFSVQTLAVFGSVVHDKLTETSDVDILITFNGKSKFDLFMDLKFYLEDMLGIRVDLVTDKALRPQVRQAIEGEIIRVA